MLVARAKYLWDVPRILAPDALLAMCQVAV